MSTRTTSLSASSSASSTRRGEFLAGFRAELPILAGTVPFGLIYGVSALKEGTPPGVAQAMSAIVFAGSAQFVMAQLIGASAPALVIALTAVVINLRHALYSASVAPYVQRLARPWRWLLAYLLTDEAYAVTIARYQALDATDALASAPFAHWYFLGAGLALWSSWQVSTAAGVFLGAQIPAAWALDFTLPLTFIALVVPTLKDRGGLVAALVAGAVAVLAVALPFKLNLVTAALLGVAAGLLADATRTRKKRKAPRADEARDGQARPTPGREARDLTEDDLV